MAVLFTALWRWHAHYLTMGPRSVCLLACVLILASHLAAALESLSSAPTENYRFNFFAEPWIAPLEDQEKLAGIADLKSTVQSLQADPLKLGAVLLKSIQFNQTGNAHCTCSLSVQDRSVGAANSFQDVHPSSHVLLEITVV